MGILPMILHGPALERSRLQLRRQPFSPFVLQIVIATANRGKRREIAGHLRGLRLKRMMSSGAPPQVEELGTTYEENAIAKACAWADRYNCIAVADDSGLEVKALGGRPGIRSARYADDRPAEDQAIRLSENQVIRRSGNREMRKSGLRSVSEEERSRRNIEKLLRELADVPASERRARFVAAVAVALPQAWMRHVAPDRGEWRSLLYVARGTCAGRIARRPRGSGGFGYDPVFRSDALRKTFAEAGTREKNRVSHRARALLKVRKFLEKRIARLQRLFPRIPEMDSRRSNLHYAR